MCAPFLPNEAARLAALHRYDILDTSPEAAFDDVCRLAAHLCATPIALISLVDADRQWFKARQGLDLDQTARDHSFCAHGILQPEVLLVPDAAADARFAANPLVTHAPHVRFYAGAPLLTPEGYAIGMLCVYDQRPRALTPEQIAALRTLSSLAMSHLERRRTAARLTQVEHERASAVAERQQALDVLHSTVEALPDGILVVDAAGQISHVNQRFVDLWGIPAALLAPRDDPQLVAWMQAQLVTPDPLLDQIHVLDSDPEVTSHAVLTLADGRVIERTVRPQQLVGVLIGQIWSFRDITARADIERALAASEQQVQDILGALTDAIWSIDLHTGRNRYVSPAIERLSGLPLAEFRANPHCWDALIHPDDRAAFQTYSATMLATGSGELEYRIVRPDGQVRWVVSRGMVTYDAQRVPIRLNGVVSDTTARKQLELERRQLQEDVIRMQEALLTELATPLIPVSDQVLVAPLIGAMDSRRAQQLLDTLLHECVAQRAEVVIIDITGVAVVDTQVANTFARVAQALRLLGAQVVLTGIRPEVAQALVMLGLEMRGVKTYARLQDGIAAVLVRRRTGVR